MAMALSVPLYTVDDLETFPNDGNRYELLDGVLLVTPAPGAPHQLVAARIQARLSSTLLLPRLAHVVGPGAVVLMPRTQLEPDILVYPSRFAPTSEWRKIDEHWLAVEVLSRSSRWYDREFKRDAYFSLGVQNVWLVDRYEGYIEVCNHAGPGEIARERITWKTPAGVVVDIDVGEIFEGML